MASPFPFTFVHATVSFAFDSFKSVELNEIQGLGKMEMGKFGIQSLELVTTARRVLELLEIMLRRRLSNTC